MKKLKNRAFLISKVATKLDPVTSPAAISKDGGATRDVFAIGLDGLLYTRWWSRSNQQWSSWSALGGNFASATPAVISRNSGQNMDLMVLNTNNSLSHNWWTRSASNWSTWSDLGGTVTSAPGGVASDEGSSFYI